MSNEPFEIDYTLNQPRSARGYDITVSGGKYRFRMLTEGQGPEVRIDRHGEDWLTIDLGSRAILSLLDLVERLELERQRLAAPARRPRLTSEEVFADGVACPFCGVTDDVYGPVADWQAGSLDSTDSDNTAKLSEMQCTACARSFWI